MTLEFFQAIDSENEELVRNYLAQNKNLANSILGDATLFKIKRTPLFIAARIGNLGIVKLLVENGATLDPEALYAAIYKNKKTVIEYLVAKNCKVPMDFEKLGGLLIQASEYKNKVALDFLKQFVSIRNESQQTQLHQAVYNYNVKLTELLLEYGADINAVDKDGNTPFVIAAFRFNYKAVDLLIRKGVKINYDNPVEFDAASRMALNNIKILSPEQDLFSAIEILNDHGAKLIDEGDREVGESTCKLASDLKQQSVDYFLRNNFTNDSFNIFKTQFQQVIDNKEAEIGKHRAPWKPIVANILLALTGIGLLIQIGKMVVSAINKDKSLFFFGTTERQNKIAEIEEKFSFLTTPPQMRRGG